jgi:hypothetical protein
LLAGSLARLYPDYNDRFRIVRRWLYWHVLVHKHNLRERGETFWGEISPSPRSVRTKARVCTRTRNQNPWSNACWRVANFLIQTSVQKRIFPRIFFDTFTKCTTIYSNVQMAMPNTKRMTTTTTTSKGKSKRADSRRRATDDGTLPGTCLLCFDDVREKRDPAWQQHTKGSFVVSL